MKEISLIKTSKFLILFSLMTLVFIGCGDDDDDNELGNWVEKSSFNGDSRYDAVTFTIDGKGYLFGGYDGDDYYSDTWVYDLAGNSWGQLSFELDSENERTPIFPGIARRAAVGFAINGKGYVGTGFGYDADEDDDIELNDFYEYDPATDTWTQIADFPGTARYGAIGFTIGNYGYVGTGYDGSQQKDFYKYDPTTNTWEEVIGYSGDKRQDASVFVINDIAYIGTGLSNGGFPEDFYSFDGTTWTELTDLDDDDSDESILLYDAAAFSINGKGYIATGISSAILNTVYEYTPSTDTWDELPVFEGTSRQSASAFSFDSADQSFVLMGRSGGSNFDDVFELKPEEEEDDED